MRLLALRQEMDETNQRLIELLARRVEIAREISRIKRGEHLPVEDQEREEAQRREVDHYAERYGLDSGVVEQIFSLIVAYCKREMERSDARFTPLQK